MNNSYNIRSTKIGNSAGFRLPADFYREHPQFANADGWIEVLSPDTAIVRIVPQLHDDKDAEDSLLMRLFLDSLKLGSKYQHHLVFPCDY